MDNRIFNTNSSFETVSDTEYKDLIEERDRYVQIGKVYQEDFHHTNRTQLGFATGFILGISAGVAFVICIIVLYLFGIINL